VARLSDESVERVREAADMAEVVGAYTDLKRAGGQLMGLCPFHDERSPSFSVEPQDKLYHCFGCGEAGDIFKFVMEKEGVGFVEAVEGLADRYGVELEREREDPQAEARRAEARRLEQLLERTSAYYSNYLWESEESGKARRYLAERGLEEGTLREFGVGFAPSAWDKILVAGQRAGFKLEELGRVGLVQRNQRGGQYDRFRARIMFPIRDRRGRVLGFGGRAMRDDQGAKYVNTAETEFFKKKKLLYGIDRAAAAIAKAGRAVVVEGYTDVLALHQAGIAEAVAAMGTSITEEQVATLSGMVDEVVLAMDADEAGEEAMLRAQRVAAGRRMRLRVALMPPGEDPAEMLAEPDGPERFRGLVEAAVELTDFQVGRVLDRTDVGSPTARDQALAEVAPILAALGETVSREELIRRVADRLDLEPALVMGRVVAATPATGGGDPGPGRDTRRNGQAQGQRRQPRPAAKLTTREVHERALLAMCIALPAEGATYLEKIDPAHLSATGARAVAWLRENLADPASNLPREDDEMAAIVTELVMRSRQEPASPDSMVQIWLQLELRRLEDQIAAAAERGDYERRISISNERALLVERIARGG
jgi:DNA primase